MALRFKIFQPNQPLKAAEMNDIAGNTVVEVDAEADLNNADLAEVNVVYRTDLTKLQIRKSAGTGIDKWSLPFDSAAPAGGVASGDHDESVQGDYKYFVFRDTQSFEVTGGGNVELMLVGAGGGGAASTTDSSGGGGGAGGSVNYWVNASVEPSYTYDVTVGLGGAGAPGTEGSAGPAGATGGTTQFAAPSPQYVNGQQVASKTWTAAGGLGGQWTNTQPSTQVRLDTDSEGAVGAPYVSGSGNEDAGPTAPLYFGQGGNGGFSRRAAYPVETYQETRYESYDCSYGASATPVYSTRTVVGDCQTPLCPGGWSVCYGNCNTGEVTCCHPDGRVMGGWWSGCPGGWSGCNGARCCTTERYQSGTSYSCPNGGSLSGTTCAKQCTRTVTETKTRACNSGYVQSGGYCVDAGVQGGGAGSDGLVILRYIDS